ncbi:hypothetical protein [Escherichia coli]|uniref:hypothetical protein n=1 Tax=Escherichia coli TaxID=562 RepID=UPI0038B2AB1D
MFRNLIVALFVAIVGIGAVIPDSLAQYTEISTNQYNLESRITASNFTESKDVTCGTRKCNAIFFQICLPGNNFCDSGDNVFKGLELPDLTPGGSYNIKTKDVDVTLNMKLSGGSANNYKDKTCAITFKILDSGESNMTMTEPDISDCNWIKNHGEGAWEVNFYGNYSKVIMEKVVTTSNQSGSYYHALGGGTCDTESCNIQLPMKYKIHDKGGSTAYDSTAYIAYSGRVGNRTLTAQVDTISSCDFYFGRSKDDSGQTVPECRLASVSFVKPYVSYKAVRVDMTVTPADTGTWTKQLYYRYVYTGGAGSWRKIENNTTHFILYPDFGDGEEDIYLRMDSSVINETPPGNYSGTIKLDFTYQ